MTEAHRTPLARKKWGKKREINKKQKRKGKGEKVAGWFRSTVPKIEFTSDVQFVFWR